MANIPSYIYDMVEYTPSIDVGLAILRDAFPDLADGRIVSLLPNKADNLPLILVRDSIDDGVPSDPFGLESAAIEIHVFTQDPTVQEALDGARSGEEQAALLSEAIRVAMRDAWLQKRTYPGVASIAKITQIQRPRRVTDWATASGPVQYADLPNGYWRYESAYRITYKPV